MPTNLPPEAIEAEERYRAAQSVTEKIARLEEFLSTIPKHKGTDKLRAGLRRRLSKLKAAAQTQKSISRQESTFYIDREGAGQVAIVGPANVGKSSLIAALTNATPEVADYPYTTREPTPGMMSVEDIQIQLIDTPPLDREHAKPELIELIRRSDLVLLLIDLQGYPIQQMEETIAVLREGRIVPRHVEAGRGAQQGWTLKPLLVVVNKYDDESLDEEYGVLRELVGEEWALLPVSATTGRNFDRLKHAVFERLGIVRVYSKPPGREADLGAPYVLEKGSTVEELARKVHQDFFEKLKAARVWGSGVYDGQMVGRDHVLCDGDIVELRV